MNIELILAVLLGFFLSEAGRDVIIWGWKQVGKGVEQTDTEIDDTAYKLAPDFLELIVKNFDLGTADKILKNFLKDLEEMEEDTSDLEDIIKNKEDEIKKQ